MRKGRKALNIEKHRKHLEKMQRDLLNQLENREEHRSLKEATQELSVVDNHPADVASENYERGKDISLEEKNRLVLEKVRRALQKIDAGRYGICERCGASIPAERLEAVPYAELCLECKSREEEMVKTAPRPVEELNLMNPFARTFTDEEDSAAYDGEDAWQDVARYNKLDDIIYEDVGEDEETLGYVEDVDKISNEQAKKQLPDS